MNPKTMIRVLLNCPELNGPDVSCGTNDLMENARRLFDINDQVIVVLRDGGGHDLFALFPEDPANALGTLCTCFCRIGGHTAADYAACIQSSKPAKGDRADLIIECLWNAGYEHLRVVKCASPAMHARRISA